LVSSCIAFQGGARLGPFLIRGAVGGPAQGVVIPLSGLRRVQIRLRGGRLPPCGPACSAFHWPPCRRRDGRTRSGPPCVGCHPACASRRVAPSACGLRSMRHPSSCAGAAWWGAGFLVVKHIVSDSTLGYCFSLIRCCSSQRFPRDLGAGGSSWGCLLLWFVLGRYGWWSFL